MKVTELLEAKRAATDKGYYTPGYDEEDKRVVGTVQDWMARLEVTKDHIADATAEAKHLPSYAKLMEMGFKDKTTTKQRANGTFMFKKPHAENAEYMVYANGQIRSSGRNRWGDIIPTRLKSPKPRLVAGNQVASLVKIYDGAFAELASKVQRIMAKMNESHDEKLSFKEFQKAAKHGKAKDFPEIMRDNGLDADTKITVYPGNCFIEGPENKEYHLIIGNTEWKNKELEPLEKTLYSEWYIEAL